MSSMKLPMMQVIPKVWGREVWLVNEPEYTCKLLEINKGSSGSLHYHPKKKETFIPAMGKVKLEYGDKTVKLKEPVTILPGIPHRFTGLKQSTILEVSTFHSDEDVVRIEESKK